MSVQLASTLMMVRPASFQFNAETAISNAFQKKIEHLTPEEIKQKAIQEFDAYVEKLRLNKINVLVIKDTPEPPKPDAIFPNNWISTTSDGFITLYPMLTANRRMEIRPDIIELLNQEFIVNEINDLTDFVDIEDGHFLEGTGSIIFDKINKIAYACISPRTDFAVFEQQMKFIGYKPISFDSYDKNNKLIYHTNVMLSIGVDFAVICLESIRDKKDKLYVKKKLEQTNHEIIDITFEQMNAFAGICCKYRIQKEKHF